jgi:hypothetical protein
LQRRTIAEVAAAGHHVVDQGAAESGGQLGERGSGVHVHAVHADLAGPQPGQFGGWNAAALRGDHLGLPG